MQQVQPLDQGVLMLLDLQTPSQLPHQELVHIASISKPKASYVTTPPITILRAMAQAWPLVLSGLAFPLLFLLQPALDQLVQHPLPTFGLRQPH